MSKRLAAVLLAALVTVSCGDTPQIDSGYVVDKRHEDGYVTQDGPYCRMGSPVGTTGMTVCTWWYYQDRYVPEYWVLSVTQCEVYDATAKGCELDDVYVSEDEWRRASVGVRWDRAA